MAKYCLKKQSKRLTCKKKFKIQRKVREHSRKLKKMSKESERKKKNEKQISVPSKCPFKEEILMEAEQKRTEAKEMEQERKARQKAAKKAGGGVVKKQSKKLATANALSSIEALAKRVAKDEDNYNANQFLVDSLPEVPGATTENSDTKAGARANAKSVRSFAAEVRRTIENADIVIEASRICPPPKKKMRVPAAMFSKKVVWRGSLASMYCLCFFNFHQFTNKKNAPTPTQASGSERKIGHQRAVKKKGAKQRKKMKKKNTVWTDETSPPPNASSLLGEEEEDNAVSSPPPSVPISSRAIRKAVKRHKKNQQKIAKSADKLALQLDEKMEV